MKLPITSLAEAESLLLRHSSPKMSGETYTLGRMQVLMEKLGNPQNNLRIIHVAGTSGKTSTAYFIRNLLEQTGKRTGLTASPHIDSITERVQIGGQPISDKQFVDSLNEFFAVINQWPEIELTYFELLIAFAYWLFAREKVEYAVIEVGLGGLLDATNVISREDKVCVITSIDLDHTEVLGHTVEAIAEQKAGIITQANHVFSAPQTPGAHAVIRQVCEEKLADLTEITLEAYPLPPQLPNFQQQNWQLARTVFDYVSSRDGLLILNDAQLKQAAYHTPPGRFEEHTIGDKTLIIDGAHNPQKLTGLMRSLAPEKITQSAWLVSLTESSDTKIDSCVELLAGLGVPIIVTEFTIGQDIKLRRCVPASLLEQKFSKYGSETVVIADLEHALSVLLQYQEKYLIVTGSLYLAAQVRSLLKD